MAGSQWAAVPLSLDPALTNVLVVAHALGVEPQLGLSSEEARQRLMQIGANELRQSSRPATWHRLLGQVTDPLIVLLLVAAVVSVAAWAVEGSDGLPVDALVIGAIVVTNAALSLVQEARAESAVAALAVMTRAQSTVKRDGEHHTIPSSELVPGDVLHLAEGDQIGADARVVSANSLRIAEAPLTGESSPVRKDPATLASIVPLGDRTDMVYKGTAVIRGTGRAVVTATGMQTEMGAIATMLDSTTAEQTPLQRELGRLGVVLGRVIVVIAIVVMVAVAVAQRPATAADWVTVLLLGVSLAVAAVPEGLPAILSVVLALGVERMARRSAVVRRLASVETLGSASVICTDKTGTLTQNEMTIMQVVTASGEVDLTGAGYSPAGQVLSRGKPIDEAAALRAEAELVLGAGSLANDAQLLERNGHWTIEGDPTEAAFLVAIRKIEGAQERSEGYARIGEVPFSSERKMMSTAHRHGDGEVVLLSKGAPDVLLDRCAWRLVGREKVPLTDGGRAEVLAEVDRLSATALRTLGVAFRAAPELAGPQAVVIDESHEHDLVFGGLVGILDPPRPEVRTAIARAHDAGLRVVMITGDHPATASRIGTDLGIAGPGERAVTGRELDGLSEKDLIDVVRRTSVFARVSPEHKLRIVDALQADGEVVAMTGDGVNDAPALRSADIGIAMGATGTEVTKEAADMVLADDNFATIVAAVREGRVIFDNIRKFLRYLLFSNMGEVLTVFFGVIFASVLGVSGASTGAIVVPLLATQILWINLVTDSAPAFAMGVDPEIDDVMGRPPRRAGTREIDRTMWFGIVTTGLTMSIVSLLTIDLFLPGGLIPGGTDTIDTARTAGFTTLVLADLFTAFNARSATSSALRGLFANHWLWGAVGLGVVLQILVVEVPFLQTAFGTTPLNWTHWAVSVAMASATLWVEEIRKLILRSRAR